VSWDRVYLLGDGELIRPLLAFGATVLAPGAGARAPLFFVFTRTPSTLARSSVGVMSVGPLIFYRRCWLLKCALSLRHCRRILIILY
jgi:hypothetical protein